MTHEQLRRWGTLLLLLVGAYVGVEGLFRDKILFQTSKLRMISGNRSLASASAGTAWIRSGQNENKLQLQREEPTVLPTTAEAVAIQFLESKRAEWGLKSYHEFRPVTFETPLGSQVKFSVFQNGIAVFGLDIEVSLSKKLVVVGHANRYRGVDYVSVDSADKQAYMSALEKMDGDIQRDKKISSTEPILFVPPEGNVPEVAYVVGIKHPIHRTPAQVIIRASDGKIIGQSISRRD